MTRKEGLTIPLIAPFKEFLQRLNATQEESLTTSLTATSKDLVRDVSLLELSGCDSEGRSDCLLDCHITGVSEGRPDRLLDCLVPELLFERPG